MVAPTKRCTFDGVGEGVSVTAASTASGSGDPIDSVAGAGYGNAQASSAINGTMGVNIGAGTAGNARFMQWQPAANDIVGAQLAFKVLPGTISGTFTFIRIQNSSGAIGADIAMTTTGIVRVLDSAGATLHTFNGGTALPIGSYVVQLTAVKGTTTSNGRVLARLRKVSDDSLMSTEYDSGATVNTSTSQYNRVNVVKIATSGTLVMDVDSFGYLVSSTAEIDRLPPISAPRPIGTPNRAAVQRAVL